MRRLPRRMWWLFWDHDPATLDPVQHRDLILARVIERGRLEDVRWLLARYGLGSIHRFLRDVGHPELSPRTITFWRALLHAEDETWAEPPAWRRTSSAPWPG